MSNTEARLSVLQKIKEHDLSRGAQIPQTLCVVVGGTKETLSLRWKTVTPAISPHAPMAALTDGAKKDMGSGLSGTFFNGAEVEAVAEMIDDGTLIRGPERVLHQHTIRPLVPSV